MNRYTPPTLDYMAWNVGLRRAEFMGIAEQARRDGLTEEEIRRVAENALTSSRYLGTRDEVQFTDEEFVENFLSEFRITVNNIVKFRKEKEKSMETIIVSRHAGAVEWLRSRGIEGRVVAHATPEDVQGCHVIGNLPLSLASYAAKVSSIEMPLLRPEQRGKDLTPAEMDAAGAALETFVVLTEAEAVNVAYAIVASNMDGGALDSAFAKTRSVTK